MYSAREVTAVLGVSAGRLRSYLRAGFVAPRRAGDGKLAFSFQDLVLLRKAEGLATSRIPPRRLAAALRGLRERLPDGSSLSAVDLAAAGGGVVVSDGHARWDACSGQLVFDFGGGQRASAPVTELAAVRAAAATAGAEAAAVGGEASSAQELYEAACAMETSSREGAADLYRRVIATDPLLADAYVNLGRLLHEDGDLQGALAHYREALALRPGDSIAAFDLGVALEDGGRIDEAVEAYRKAVASDPGNADAHYNLARLHEQTGHPELAIRHLIVYRQLTRGR